MKEKNLKISIKDLLEKIKAPASDPDANLVVMIQYPPPFEKKIGYYGNYKNHIVTDRVTELLLREKTICSIIHDTRICKSLIQKFKNIVRLALTAVIWDVGNDSDNFLHSLLMI